MIRVHFVDIFRQFTLRKDNSDVTKVEPNDENDSSNDFLTP